MTGTASKTVSLDGTDVELKAKNGLTENGANVDIKANGMLNARLLETRLSRALWYRSIDLGKEEAWAARTF